MSDDPIEQLQAALNLLKGRDFQGALSAFEALAQVPEVAQMVDLPLYMALAAEGLSRPDVALNYVITYLKRVDAAAEAYDSKQSLAWLKAAHWSAQVGEWQQAMQAYDTLLSHEPQHPAAHLHMINVGLHCFDWERLERSRQALAEMRDVELDADALDKTLLAFHSFEVDPEILWSWHHRWAMGTLMFTPVSRRQLPAEGPWHIGFLTPDAREHSVGYFLVDVIKALAGGPIKVSVYHTHPQRDALTDKLAEHGTVHHTVGLNPQPLAERIAADEVDVLIDCAGHTANHALGVMARRAAPLQITAIGYPNSTAVDTVDYRLCDAVTDPESQTWLGSEKPWRQNQCFLPFPQWASVEATARVDLGLPAEACVFGVVNALTKLTPAWLGTINRILREAPDAHLVLGCRADHDSGAKDRVLAIVAEGVEASRIHWWDRVETVTQHRQRLAALDVALDSYPYNGTTTTFECLAMGVPVLTHAGQTHVSRTSASILSHLALDELVTDSEDGFVTAAVAVATDANQRKTLQSRVKSAVGAVDRAAWGTAFADSLQALIRSHSAST